MSLAEELLADLDDIGEVNDDVEDEDIVDVNEQLQMASKMDTDGSIPSLTKLNKSEVVSNQIRTVYKWKRYNINIPVILCLLVEVVEYKGDISFLNEIILFSKLGTILSSHITLYLPSRKILISKIYYGQGKHC